MEKETDVHIFRLKGGQMEKRTDEETRDKIAKKYSSDYCVLVAQ